MTKPDRPKMTPAYSAAVHEIGAYYEVPDLPDEGPIWGSGALEEVAADHARTIRFRAGLEHVAEAARVLRGARAAPFGPFMKDVVTVTRYGWWDDPRELEELFALMEAIALELDGYVQQSAEEPGVP